MRLSHSIKDMLILIFRRIRCFSVERKLLPILLIFIFIFVTSTALSLSALAIQASMRAYIVGESLWSKSQRNATFFLEKYARSRNPAYLEKFRKAMTVPLGYRTARLELLKPDYDRQVVTQGLLQGGTHGDDIPGVIRLFRCCSRYSHFQQAIDAWTTGDAFLLKLEKLALDLERELKSPQASDQRIEILLANIETVSEEIHSDEVAFINALGNGARAILQWLRFITIGVAVLLIILGSYISLRILKKVHQSEARYRVLFNSANDAIFVFERSNGKVLEANHSTASLTGKSAHELRNSVFYDFFPPDSDNGKILPCPQSGHQTSMLANGRHVPVEVSGSFTQWGEHPACLAIVRDISERQKSEREKKEYEQRLQHLALYDLLTQLPNRATFQERGEQAIARALWNKSKSALLLIDLDGFKLVNDTYGHAVGDYLLQVVAGRIQSSLSTVDLAGRLGGDQFTVLLENVAARDDVIELANKLLAEISENTSFGDSDISTFVSIGISFFPDDASSLQELLTHADTAMYQAKRRGRNNFQIFSPSMVVNVSSRLQLSSSLRHAVDRGQFELYYQPCIDIENEDLVAVEALLRWHHPKLGMVPPDVFIPLAEETGLIGSITDWVLKTACTQGMLWIGKGYAPIQIAVNISPATFWDAALPANIHRILMETGWQTNWLCLEITETALRHQEKSKAMLHELNEMGIRLAIDDFGVGYSSLSYLRHFPVHYLKIDQSFIKRSVQDQNDAAITRAIIALAKSLSLSVIAEGVETAEQGEFLRIEGCDEAQGYFFGKPMPALKLEALLTVVSVVH